MDKLIVLAVVFLWGAANDKHAQINDGFDWCIEKYKQIWSGAAVHFKLADNFRHKVYLYRIADKNNSEQPVVVLNAMASFCLSSFHFTKIC